MQRHLSFLLKINPLSYSLFPSFFSLSLPLSPLSLTISLSLSLSDRWRECSLACIKHARTLSFPAGSAKFFHGSSFSPSPYLFLFLSDQWRGCTHPCKHKACPHSKHSSFSQSFSMRDYHVNDNYLCSKIFTKLIKFINNAKVVA